MDIFISWSGPRSRAVATALYKWLPKIVNAFKPWLSSEDLDKGTRWSADVAGRLEQSKAGIVCLTPGNLHADWILFEAGALSKQVANAYVCPLLVGMEPADVKGPLAQFQATKLVKDDLIRLVNTLNSALGEQALSEAHIQEAFEVWWPRLEKELQTLPSDHGATRPQRSELDILEEILALVRSQNRNFPPPGSVSSVGSLIHRVARETDPTITQSNYTSSDDAHFVTLSTSKGQKKYQFEFPLSLSLDELESTVKERIRKALKAAAISEIRDTQSK